MRLKFPVSTAMISADDKKPKARGPRRFKLTPVRRFLNLWLTCAVVFGISGLALGLMKAAPHGYLDRELPGVYLSTVQAHLGPALLNGLAAGLWFAVLAMTSRFFGGRHRIRFALLAFLGCLLLILAQLFSMYFGSGGVLLSARILVRWGSVEQLLRSLIALGMEEEPPRVRLMALTLLGLSGLGGLGLLHLFTRRWLGAKIDDPAAKPPLRPLAPIMFIVLSLMFLTLGRSATDFLPRGSPDLILISIDTLRADHLSCYGYHRKTSPNLDRLAAEGILVENFIAHAPWTLPAHASMFTGLLPYRHGAVEPQIPLEPKMGVFPELLKQKGYRTAGYVTGILVSQTFGFDRGFDIYSFRDFQNATKTVAEAGGWLLRKRDPSFLFLHLFDLHYPYRPPPAFYTRFGPPSPFLMLPRSSDFGVFLKWADRSPDYTAVAAMNRYDELILYVDFVLGKFFDGLKRQGRYDNALIVVVSDHGEEFFDHGAWGHSQHLYDESIRVPLIVKLPGGACAGARLVNATIPQRAIPSIFLAAAEEIPGSNPHLACGPDGIPRLLSASATSAPVLSETQFSWRLASQGAHRFASRTTKEKLLEPYRPLDPRMSAYGHDWQLFDLEEDPGENRNVYEPGKASALEESLARANEELISLGAKGSATKLDQETLDRLRSLGYLQ